MAYGKGWVENKITAQGDGAALASSTIATSILPAQGKPTLEPQNGSFIGKKYRVKASGRVSTVVTTAKTLTLDVRFGAVVVFNGGAMTMSVTALTNVTWEAEMDLLVRTVGGSTTATVLGTGRFTSEAAGSTTVAGEAKSIMMPTSAPVAGTGFDSTATQTVDLFATWSVSNAANSITLHQFEFTEIN